MDNKENKINGFTLVEVLVSVVILAILIITFMLIFLQTMKTTNTSDDIIDWTYIAQTEMEKMYELTKEPYVDKNQEIVDKLNFNHNGTDGDWSVFEKEGTDGQSEIVLKWKDEDEEDGSSLTVILIEVYDKNNRSQPKVQMENWLDWKADTNE